MPMVVLQRALPWLQLLRFQNHLNYGIVVIGSLAYSDWGGDLGLFVLTHLQLYFSFAICLYGGLYVSVHCGGLRLTAQRRRSTSSQMSSLMRSTQPSGGARSLLAGFLSCKPEVTPSESRVICRYGLLVNGS